jgi:hypothetical protein
MHAGDERLHHPDDAKRELEDAVKEVFKWADNQKAIQMATMHTLAFLSMQRRLRLNLARITDCAHDAIGAPPRASDPVLRREACAVCTALVDDYSKDGLRSNCRLPQVAEE